MPESAVGHSLDDAESISFRPAPDARLRRFRLRNQLVHLPALLIPAAIIAVWEIYCRAAHVDPTVLPTPSRILAQLWDFRSEAGRHTLQTLKETGVGFATSISFAFIVAVLMDQLRWLSRGLYPMLVGSQTIPIIAIATLMFIWFGFGLLHMLMVIIVIYFFSIIFIL